jgi:hypothetical protein
MAHLQNYLQINEIETEDLIKICEAILHHIPPAQQIQITTFTLLT